MGVTALTCSKEVFRFSLSKPAERSVVIEPEGYSLFLIEFTWFNNVDTK
jgi:hypothetical protein